MPNKVEEQSMIFDIERYATKDGPGIRTVVFFKGCNLRCLWCQNPESQIADPQIMYYRSQCTACGRCLEACPQNAIYDDPDFGLITNHAQCITCGACVDACFSNARRLIGRLFSIDEVMEQIMRDKAYYENSGGGVTFSGGEPLLQAKFIFELAKRCKKEGIHTAIETAGMVSIDTMKLVLPIIDLIYLDFKHINPEEHFRTIGAYPDQIKKNLKWISQYSDKLIIRIPIIPKINNDEETLHQMFSFLSKEISGCKVELLPFHRLGLGKYEGLGMKYAMKDIANLEDSDCEKLALIGRKMGLTVQTGIGQ